MKFENSEYYKTLKHFKLELPFGHYYLCDNFFIGEMNEGVHIDWKKTKIAIDEIINYYGEDVKLGFISNRINPYSIDPNNWVKVENKYSILTASAIVMYSSSTYMNASIEKQFAKKSIKRCMSLLEAIEWMTNLKELKKEGDF